MKIPSRAIKSEAIFSKDLQHRWLLERRFAPHPKRFVQFIMLNPSTADETDNDPTVNRCELFALDRGFDGLLVTNLFALRSTDPKGLYDHDSPVGAENDHWIRAATRKAELTICAWGNHGRHQLRARQVTAMLKKDLPKHTLHALRLNGSGEPAHPLYLPKSLEPFHWEGHA